MAETTEIIQARMLNNISNEYDKTEGSFIYDLEKPIAIELENMGKKVESILDKGFADTAVGSDLDRIVYEQGISRKVATKAKGTVVIAGIVGATISVGEMVASDNVNFVFLQNCIIPESKSIEVPVECAQFGTIGNVPAGAIKYFPKTLEGLQSVANTATFTNGYDAETDESLRQRYYDKVRTPATSGNIYHYLNWSKETTGVGDARIVPLWNGNGTVKVIIINSNKRAADSALIESVTTHIEENRPIGATVTVVSATELAINVSVTLTLATGYVLENVKTTLEANLTQYFKDIAFKETYVSYAKIGNIIFDSLGVLDYSGLTVNGGIVNVPILDSEIAVLGGVSIG